MPAFPPGEYLAASFQMAAQRDHSIRKAVLAHSQGGDHTLFRPVKRNGAATLGGRALLPVRQGFTSRHAGVRHYHLAIRQANSTTAAPSAAAIAVDRKSTRLNSSH